MFFVHFTTTVVSVCNVYVCIKDRFVYVPNSETIFSRWFSPLKNRNNFLASERSFQKLVSVLALLRYENRMFSCATRIQRYQSKMFQFTNWVVIVSYFSFLLVLMFLGARARDSPHDGMHDRACTPIYLAFLHVDTITLIKHFIR